jgi:hypothetical protein
MRSWSNYELQQGIDVPAEITELWNELALNLPDHGGEASQLVSMSLENEDRGLGFAALIQLSPDVRMSVELNADLTIDMEEGEATDIFLGMVYDTFSGCLPRIDELAESSHRARIMARKIFASWQKAGVPTRLIDVQLADYDNWLSEAPNIAIVFETLDGRLEPVEETAFIGKMAAMERHLTHEMEALKHRHDRRAALGLLGASGSISRIALNAIEHFGDVDATLRRFATEWRFWLPDDTALIMEDGSVTAGNGTGNALVQWFSDKVTFSRTELPQDRLMNGIGRPVTDLIDHEFLSSDMIVLDASRVVLKDGFPALSLTLDVPELLFCSASGRVWSPEVERPGQGDDVIVPFKRKS